MPITHVLLAFSVVFIWGINFLFVKLALTEISPLFLCTLRFVISSIPAVFFIKPPRVSFRIVILYGLVMFGLQFAFLFVGLYVGMTAGMASLVMQMQVFFSMFFAAIYLKETPTFWQISGAIIAFSGIGIVAMHLDKNISLLGFMMILASAATWGVGNLITKKAKDINMISLVIWGSFVTSIPMMITSLIIEGPARIVESVSHLTWVGGISVLYIVYISTWVGYGVWNWLIARYPVSTVVPFTLLVPIVGIMSSVMLMGETFELWKLIAGLLVICGLCVNLLGIRIVTMRMQPSET